MGIEVAIDLGDLLRVGAFELVDVCAAFLQVFLRIIDHDDHVAGFIAAEDLVFDLGGARRCRVRIFPAFLAHAVFQLRAKDSEEHQD